jgi:hypothetical protein
MNSWEKDAFRQRQCAELGGDTKRKGTPTSTIPTKQLSWTKLDMIADSITLKASTAKVAGKDIHGKKVCKTWTVQ